MSATVTERNAAGGQDPAVMLNASLLPPEPSGRSAGHSSATAAALIPPLVHLLPFHRLTRMLATSRGGDPRAAPPDDALAEWVDRLLRAAPWPWRQTCLKRAAVLFYLLGRAGRPAMISIGVRRTPGSPLAAHAWLTQEDAVILEPESAEVRTFEPIARFPEPSRGPGRIPVTDR